MYDATTILDRTSCPAPPTPPHHTLSPTPMAPKRKRVAEPAPEDKSAGSGATPAEVSKVKVEPQEPCMSY